MCVLNMKCPLQAHVVEHFVPTWWHCWEAMKPLQRGRAPRGHRSQETSRRLCDLVLFCASCFLIHQGKNKLRCFSRGQNVHSTSLLPSHSGGPAPLKYGPAPQSFKLLLRVVSHIHDHELTHCFSSKALMPL